LQRRNLKESVANNKHKRNTLQSTLSYIISQQATSGALKKYETPVYGMSLSLVDTSFALESLKFSHTSRAPREGTDKMQLPTKNLHHSAAAASAFAGAAIDHELHATTI
jgi:hypothetical protein